MTDFVDWDPAERMALRTALDAIGADFRTDYESAIDARRKNRPAGVTIAVPRDASAKVRKIATAHGLRWHSDYQFPLGCVQGIPQELRCDCWTYGGERNVWHMALLVPVEEGTE